MADRLSLRRAASTLALFAALAAPKAWAQVTPAAAYTPPDDTPAVKIGGVIFADYTYTDEPQTTVEGKKVNPSSFNVGRAYLNVTGTISHLFAFRVTPDIVRETGAGSSIAGSYTFRLKYAYGQFNLDDWAPKGSWVRFGLQQTPWVDFEEGVYRYRFQGTVFSDREKFLTSSDNALSAKFNFANNYGDIHFGIYNGDGYTKAEANDQKALQVRATVRPAPQSSLQGLRFSVFYDGDNYASGDTKTRTIGAVTWEHPAINVAAQVLSTEDKPTNTAVKVKGEGFSVWATPKFGHGWEALLRYDELKPNTHFSSQKKTTTIAGIAYWVPVQKGVSGAILLDYEQVKYDHFAPAKPSERRLAIHTLISF